MGMSYEENMSAQDRAALKARRDLANTIALQAEALAAGKVESEAMHLSLILNNVQTLIAWSPTSEQEYAARASRAFQEVGAPKSIREFLGHIQEGAEWGWRDRREIDGTIRVLSGPYAGITLTDD